MGTLSLLTLTFPILVTPIVADDFFNPLYQLPITNGGYLSSLKYGLASAWDGASLRLLGNGIGALTNNLLVDLQGRFEIPISFTFGLIKFLGFLLLAISIAILFVSSSGRSGKHSRILARTFLYCCVILGSILQISALWSNDPIADYPLAGVYTAAFSVLLFAITINWSRNLTWTKVITLSVLATSLLFYYELSFLVAPLVSLILLRQTISKKHKFAFFAKCALPTVSVFLFIILSRMKTSTNMNTYGGASLRLNSRVLGEFLLSLISSLPGAGWNLSSEFIDLASSPRFYSVGAFLLIVFVLSIGVSEKSDQQTTLTKDSSTLFTTVIIALWALSAVALQASTVKVQDEVNRIGQVYTFSPFVIAFVLFLIVSVFSSKLKKPVVLLMVLGLSIFGSLQTSINWGLVDEMNASLVPNRLVLNSLSKDMTMLNRCANLRAWSGGNWPDYYEVGVINGLMEYGKIYWNNDFCTYFIRPD